MRDAQVEDAEPDPQDDEWKTLPLGLTDDEEWEILPLGGSSRAPGAVDTDDEWETLPLGGPRVSRPDPRPPCPKWMGGLATVAMQLARVKRREVEPSALHVSTTGNLARLVVIPLLRSRWLLSIDNLARLFQTPEFGGGRTDADALETAYEAATFIRDLLAAKRVAVWEAVK